jgi:hypothetical protein
MDLAKSTFGQDWESGGDYDYDTEEIKMLVKKLGGGYKIVYVDSEQREKFENAKSKYLPLLKNKSNDGDIFVIPNKKMADGGFTPDVSDGTQFMSGVYAKGGGIRSKEELKKIFSEKEAIVKNLTPKEIAEMWNKNSYGVKQGISKPITIEEAKKPSMKMYLENLLIENELTEEEQAKYFAKGGFVATVEFNVGDIVWDKGNKTYGTVMNNFGDPINGDGGELRLDSDGMQVIFLYDKGYKNRIGYNLVKLGDKGDAGKFTPIVLDELKASAERMIKYRRDAKDKEGIKIYQEIYKRTLDGEFDSMVGRAKATTSNKKGSSDYTYVPNKDVKELSVVLKGELKKLMGSDILDGVYVKNSAKSTAKSTAKVDANAVFSKILKDAKEAKSGKTKKFTATDLKKLNLEMVEKLVEAGYTEQQVRNIIFSYTFDNEVIAEGEFDTQSGIFYYEDAYIKSKIDNLVEAQKNKEFAVGIEYPDFDWQGIIKKYKISSKPKDIIERPKGFSGLTENYYEVFVGENIVIGHSYGYKWLDADGKVISNYMEEDKKVSDPTKQNAWQKERGQKAGFNGGWWTVISSKIEIIDDVLKTLLSQKGGYCKELEFYDDSLPKALKENNIAFADGGMFDNNDGYNLKDINGKKIEVGDTVKTTQQSGGLFNPNDSETGIVEKTKDAFGQESLQIRYRKQGTNYDRFILLNGKINEIVHKSSSSFELGGDFAPNVSDGTQFMSGVYANGGGFANDPFYKAFMEKRDKLYAQLKSRVVRAVGIDEAMEFFDYEYSNIAPYKFIERAVQSNLIALDEINKELVDSAMEEAREIDNDEDLEEIGSSDFTYYLQHVLDGAGFKVGFVNDRLQRLNEDGSVKEISNNFADGGFMNDVYADGGEVKDKDGFNLYGKLDNTIKKDFWVWEYKKPSDVIEDRSDSEDYEDGTEKAVVDYCIARMQRGYIHAFHIQGKNGDDFNFVSKTWQDAWDKYDNDDYDDIDDEENDDDDDSYADGGNLSEIRWQDVQKGDSARVKETNKMGVIFHGYGRKFNLRFIDGTEKTYDASELEFYKDREFADGGFMNDVYAKGGSVETEIHQLKRKLIQQAKSKGISENFGQKEVRMLEDKYPMNYSVGQFDEWVQNFDLNSYANGGMFDDNDGFMKADNNNNYRYPEMEVYVETLDEPIDLTNNVSSRTNQVVIMPLDEKIDLNDDSRVRARMGYEPKNRTPEKMMMVNPRMIVNNLPTPMSNTHKND